MVQRAIKKRYDYIFKRAYQALDDYRKYYQFFLMGEVTEDEVRLTYKRYVLLLTRAERRLGE